MEIFPFNIHQVFFFQPMGKFSGIQPIVPLLFNSYGYVFGMLCTVPFNQVIINPIACFHYAPKAVLVYLLLGFFPCPVYPFQAKRRGHFLFFYFIRRMLQFCFIPRNFLVNAEHQFPVFICPIPIGI